MEKRCTKCGNIKALDMFSPHSRTKDKKRSWCKPCCSAAAFEYAQDAQNKEKRALWAKQNADKKRAASKRHYEKNKEAARLKAKEYREKNPERVALQLAASKAKNLKSVYARNNARSRLQKMATPSWADRDALAAIYKAAARLRQLGRPVCVDHIVPLVSDRVCGLHVKNNLQIIPTSENSRKRNVFWPNMPEGT